MIYAIPAFLAFMVALFACAIMTTDPTTWENET